MDSTKWATMAQKFWSWVSLCYVLWKTFPGKLLLLLASTSSISIKNIIDSNNNNMNVWYFFDTMIGYWSIQKCSYARMGSTVLWFQNWFMEWLWVFYWPMEVSRKTTVFFWINLYIYLRGNIIDSSAKGIFLDFLLSVGTILRVESLEII